MKENCGTFIPYNPVFIHKSWVIFGKVFPNTACAAKLIRLVLMNLETNGIERDARMFNSMTYA